jgi:hypothetical protein
MKIGLVVILVVICIVNLAPGSVRCCGTILSPSHCLMMLKK